MGDFSKDYRRGKVGENKLLNLFKDFNYKQNKSKGRVALSKWDFSFDIENKTSKGEVKYDWMESKTGNIAIEYHNPKLNKPSGLSVTNADFWFIVLSKPIAIWGTSVDTLKEFCNNVKPKRIIECGGDDNASLWLYKKTDILPNCFLDFTDANPDKIVILIKELENAKSAKKENCI